MYRIAFSKILYAAPRFLRKKLENGLLFTPFAAKHNVISKRVRLATDG